jgi:hypothetical protein
MDLINFYFSVIFGGHGLPFPSDVCADGEQIKNYCSGLLTGLNAVCIITVLSLIVLLCMKRFKLAGKAFVLSTVLLPLAFITVDHILKQLSDVASFGKEWFVISFYIWCYIGIAAFLKAISFCRGKFYTLAFLAVTIVATIMFALTGRGTIEHITPIIGGLLADVNFEYLALSFVAKLIAAFFAIGFVSWIIIFTCKWVISGELKTYGLGRIAALTIAFSAISLISVASLPFGEKLNEKDLREAEAFIDEVTKSVNKYKLENGEYPKTISPLLVINKDYPRLLARHDYLSYGTTGAYYFSRKDKFCFVFQNPARKLGYHSKTSSRDRWRFSSYKGSLEEEYINVCDEQMAGSDNIIGGSLGLTDPYSEIEEMAAQVGAETQKPAITLKASQALKDVINEYGKEDPTIFDLESLKDGKIVD